MNLLSRSLEAYKEGRLLSDAISHFADAISHFALSEPILRFHLGLPEAGGRDLPAIVTSGAFFNTEGEAVKTSLKTAIDGRSKLPAAIRAIHGMSGQRYRSFINNLIETLDRPRYLEIGSWLGSTAAAAIYGNNVQAVCIDNWSQYSATKEQFQGKRDLDPIDLRTSDRCEDVSFCG